MKTKLKIIVVFLLLLVFCFNGNLITNAAESKSDSVEDGVYEIVSLINQNIAFDITDGSKENGAVIQLWQNVHAEQQQFMIKNDNEGYYTIQSRHSGKYLTAGNANPNWGEKIVQQDEKNDDTQKWSFKKQSDGSYNIISKCGNLNIDIPDWNCSNGVKIQLWGNNESATAQKFVLLKQEVGTKNVQEGTYIINSKINQNIAFDITDGSKKNGAVIQLWQDVGAERQKFILEYVDEGYYKIKSKYTGKYLTVANANPAWGTKITQQDEKNDDTQEWSFKKQSDGSYNIISKCGGLNIDIPDWNCSNGVKVQMWGNNESATAQKFVLTKQEEGTKNVEEGTYQICSTINKNIMFDITNGSNSNGALIQLWESAGANQQKFVLEYVDEGYYKIKSKYTGKYLTVANSNPAWGSKITQQDEKNDDTQEWSFKKQSDGSYNIISKCGGLNIDIPDWNCSNGVKVQLWTSNESATAQRFWLVKEEERKGQKTVEDSNYRILSKLNTNESFDIDCGSKEDGAKAQIWWDINSLQQKFEIKYYQDGYYKIVSRNSNKVLTIENTNTRYGVGIIQETDSNKDSQLWIIDKVDSGVYQFISKIGNLALSVENGNDGTKLTLGKVDKSLNNEFILVDEQPEKNADTSVKDGIYNITLTNGKVIDVNGASFDNNANIQIWDRGAVQQQKFRITRVSNQNYYKITAVHSAKNMQVQDSGILIGTNVNQGNSNSQDNQNWYLIDAGNGYYYIVSKSNSLYLQTVNINQNASNIQLGYNDNRDNTKFKLTPVNMIENGPFEIETRISNNRVLDIDRGSYDNGANVQIWQPQNKNQERFTFESIASDEVIIRNYNSGKVLTVEDNGNVVQYDYYNGENQHWKVIERGENYYSFKCKSNNRCLDIDNASTANGTNVKTWDDNGNAAQQFRIVSGYRKFYEEGIYGTSGKSKAGQGGYNLQYYKIGQGSKHLFLAFSIHGFEDAYSYDGQELTYIANQLKDYLYNNITEEMVNKWTIYIFPNLNPDGQYDGWTNNGPGRTTLYSYAPNNKGIDMNRGWSEGYKRMSGDRNYNGTQPFQAPEAAQLRDFILSNQGSSNIVIDTHGWLNETIGDNGIGAYYRSQFGISNHIGSYGSGYFINWARSIANTRSMLLELPQVNNHNQTLERNYAGKFINATLGILRDF